MKKILIQTVFFIALMISFCTAMAQPKAGSVILGYFEKSPLITYTATVLSVNGNQFTVRFAQSNTEYIFSSKKDYDAKVVSSKGGKYTAGSTFFFMEYFISDNTYGCILNKIPSATVIAKFPDGKAFLGSIIEFTNDGGCQVTFWHSGSMYNLDKDGLVISQSGGAYKKGTAVKIFCAKRAGEMPVGLSEPTPEKQ